MNYQVNNEAIEAVNSGEDIPTFLYDESGNKSWHLKWVSTDAWRGYYTITALKNSGWVKINFDGWVTGNWPDAPIDARSDTVETKLEALAKDYKNKGYQLAVVFTPTSNLFSTSYDVFVKKITT